MVVPPQTDLNSISQASEIFKNGKSICQCHVKRGLADLCYLRQRKPSLPNTLELSS